MSVLQDEFVVSGWRPPFFAALHELDPVFRKVTLENERLKSLVRDLKFHRDPVGELHRDAPVNSPVGSILIWLYICQLSNPW